MEIEPTNSEEEMLGDMEVIGETIWPLEQQQHKQGQWLQQDMETQLYAWDVVQLRYFKGVNALAVAPTQCIKTFTGYDIIWGEENTQSSILGNSFIKLRINPSKNTFALTYSVGYNGAQGHQSYFSCTPCVTRLNELLRSGTSCFGK